MMQSYFDTFSFGTDDEYWLEGVDNEMLDNSPPSDSHLNESSAAYNPIPQHIQTPNIYQRQSQMLAQQQQQFYTQQQQQQFYKQQQQQQLYMLLQQQQFCMQKQMQNSGMNCNKNKKQNRNLPGEAKKEIIIWLENHENDPNPSLEYKTELSVRYNVNIETVKNFIMNYKKRYL